MDPADAGPARNVAKRVAKFLSNTSQGNNSRDQATTEENCHRHSFEETGTTQHDEAGIQSEASEQKATRNVLNGTGRPSYEARAHQLAPTEDRH